MTMFMTELILLKGNEEWVKWGEGWWDHVERVGELPNFPGGVALMAGIERLGHEPTKIDWGAWLYRLSAREISHIYGEDACLIPSWPMRRDHDEDWKRPLADLPEGTYGLVVVECY